MLDKPVIAQRTPCIVEVGPGAVNWCQCGRSKTQPFCDGSHTGPEFSPMEVHFEEKKRVAYCGCKQTKQPAFRVGLTRGSNHVVPEANPHSECERPGGSAGCVSTTHPN